MPRLRGTLLIVRDEFATQASNVAAYVEKIAHDLVAIRRELHTHPELAWQEQRTTGLIEDRLTSVGVACQRLPRSGLIADVGTGDGPVVALRADMDALPVHDTTEDPWRSTVPGVAHACGHDVHTTALLGAAHALAEMDAHGQLPGRVRLLFQPAEEVMPGGALGVISSGGLEGVSRLFALHCDPTLDVGRVGLREGPITGAADALGVHLKGRGGHTSRPHNTQDLTYALAKIVSDLPAVLSRRLDPRAGASVVWGEIRAGTAKNVIPSMGEAAGTVRMLDADAWRAAREVITTMIHELAAPYGVEVEVEYVRGVPPVVNDSTSIVLLASAALSAIGEDAVTNTAQTLGGEDFAWYLESVPGAMARLGTRTPGGPTYDLHQGNLRVDEGAVAVGAKLLAAAAVRSLDHAAVTLASEDGGLGKHRRSTDSITN
ncbi:MAG: amidohydrolase [Propionibacteriales bacterium]|nr:amidohydrolase [Propionibacteriales bacterium]